MRERAPHVIQLVVDFADRGTSSTASRFFRQYYLVELLFGVPNHLGVDDETALEQTVDLLKCGMFKRP